MLPYNRNLKQPARRLRRVLTDAEHLLWSRLRRKQILGVQFYRQKPLGPIIVDFYAPEAHIVVEVDGSQHMDAGHAARDVERDQYCLGQGLCVLRFDNAQVLRETTVVVEMIYRTIVERNPPQPPFSKGGIWNKAGTLIFTLQIHSGIVIPPL
ncbi:MAG: endonuclease domain-containing protein [Nitrospirota bacterium]